jgi:hypothetical protein
MRREASSASYKKPLPSVKPGNKACFCFHAKIAFPSGEGGSRRLTDEESTSCIASSDSVLHKNIIKEESAIACTERYYTVQTLLSSSTTAVVPLPRWGRLIQSGNKGIPLSPTQSLFLLYPLPSQ